jgi:hypothetical protein
VETTERIAESYVRYVKGWLTIPNIRCEGQFEIDLIAIDPNTLARYHIESGVSVSGSYSKLTKKPYSSDTLKVRVQQAGQRRTLGYFIERKFGNPNVIKALKKYGFVGKNYSKIIVTWGCQDGVEEQAKKAGVIIWDFRSMIDEIGAACVDKRSYFGDDTLRTLHLVKLAEESNRKQAAKLGSKLGRTD